MASSILYRHVRNPLHVWALSLAIGAVLPPADHAHAVEPGEPRIENILVIGNRHGETDLRTPQAVSQIEATTMAERSYRTTPQALSHQPGVMVQKTAHGQGSAFIRGLTGKQVLVLIDGMRLNNSTFRFGPNQYLSTVPISSIERVEILRGPAGALYGSDAIGGVINVVTAADSKESFGRIESTYGSSDNERSLGLDAARRHGSWSLRAGLGRRAFNDVHGGGDVGKQAHTGYDEQHVHASALRKLDSGGRWGMSFSRAVQTDVPRTDKYVNDREKYLFEEQSRWAGTAHADLPLATAWADNLQARLQRQVQQEHVLRQRFGSDLQRHVHDRVTTDGLNLQLDKAMGGHLLIYGAELYRDRVDSHGRRIEAGAVRSSGGSFPDGSEYTTAEGFAHLSVTAGERWLVDAGVRYSGFRATARLPDYGGLDERYSNLTGSLRGSWEFRPGWRWFAGVASGFRAPNLDDLVVLKSTNEGVDVPSPGLDPEQLINYEMGIKHAAAGWQATLVAFDSRFTDLIERKPGLYRGLPFIDDDGDGAWDPGEDGVVQKFNIGKARIYGIELDASVRFAERYRAALAISYMRGNNESGDEPLSRIQPLQAMVSLRRDFPAARSWMEGILRAARAQHRISARDAADPRIGTDGTAGFAEVSFYAGTRLGERHEFSVSLNNLLDQKFKTHGSGVYEPGRSFKISYAFEI